jgi:hypothetical protein
VADETALAGHDVLVLRRELESLDHHVVFLASQEQTGVLGADMEE